MNLKRTGRVNKKNYKRFPNINSVSARTASVSASRAIKNNKQALNWLGGC